MKLQKALRIILSAALFFTFLLSPIRSNPAKTKDRRTSYIHVQVNEESSSGHSFKLDLTLPVNNKKEKENDHNNGADLFRHKRHADEDRHDHHHHDFDKLKHRKRIVRVLSALLLKIFIAISYFSILFCTYMSIVNH